MNKIEFKNPTTGRLWTRITKAQARRIFKKGGSFLIAPCNCRLFTMWSVEHFVDAQANNGDTFDKIINAFTYYNCNNELGRYPAFYIVQH